MNDRDPTIEAYQVLADLLVTIRRVIQRGLEKVSGKTWYLDGCPPGLFEQLVARKEKEISIDRFGGEYQELITFASLDDLAAIIEYNADLGRLLASFESEGSPIIERLREIEALRLKMAASVPFDDEDMETITRYHHEFRQSLTRRKRAVDAEAVAATGDENVATQAATGIDPPEETAGDESAGIEPDRGTQAVERPPEFSTQAVTFEELVDVVGGRKSEPDEGESSNGDGSTARPVPDLATASPVGTEGPSPVVEAELAMAEDDDRKVLRALHREVTVIAEGAFRKMLDIGHPVWDVVRSSGWYDMKKADLALAPLELFYTVVARAADVQHSGAGFEAVKACLEEAEFSKLLLTLRDMFMRHGL